jgi:hypothetical protein
MILARAARELHAVCTHQQMAVWWRHVDASGLDARSAARVYCGQRSYGIKDLRKLALEVRGGVQHDEHRCREVAGQMTHQLLQGTDAARRCAHHQNVRIGQALLLRCDRRSALP